MKKILTMLIAIVSVSFGASAATLKETYDALSKIPALANSVEKGQPNSIVAEFGKGDNRDINISSASGLDKPEILKTGEDVFSVLEGVSMQHLINGASNQYAASLIYAQPTTGDRYDVLVVMMSGFAGDVLVVYFNTNEATVTGFQDAKLTLQGGNLTVVPAKEADSTAFSFQINSPM